MLADLAGLEVALALALMLALGAPGVPVALTAAACAAWLIRDGRAAPAARAAEVQDISCRRACGIDLAASSPAG